MEFIIIDVRPMLVWVRFAVASLAFIPHVGDCWVPLMGRSSNKKICRKKLQAKISPYVWIWLHLVTCLYLLSWNISMKFLCLLKKFLFTVYEIWSLHSKTLHFFLYFSILQSVPYYRMKLMLVGYGGRGKSTLLARLQKQKKSKKFANVATVGIKVQDWK